jgi:hypothetical protein
VSDMSIWCMAGIAEPVDISMGLETL